MAIPIDNEMFAMTVNLKISLLGHLRRGWFYVPVCG